MHLDKMHMCLAMWTWLFAVPVHRIRSWTIWTDAQTCQDQIKLQGTLKQFFGMKKASGF